MSYGSRGGRPYTRRLTVPSSGIAYVLPVQSAELIFRPQSGSARLYWREADYLGDSDGTSPTADSYMALNSSPYPGEVRLRVNVGTVYLRGDAEIELTVIGQG